MTRIIHIYQKGYDPNFDDDPNKNYILSIPLRVHPKKPNSHTFLIRESDGKTFSVYEFTKDQFNSLIGMSKLDACRKICGWFKEAGIDLTGR